MDHQLQHFKRAIEAADSAAGSLRESLNGSVGDEAINERFFSVLSSHLSGARGIIEMIHVLLSRAVEQGD